MPARGGSGPRQRRWRRDLGGSAALDTWVTNVGAWVAVSLRLRLERSLGQQERAALACVGAERRGHNRGPGADIGEIPPQLGRCPEGDLLDQTVALVSAA